MSEFRSRLAPTPSGFLHRGNAFSFLLTWLMVRKSKGRLLLRIDDIDADRKRPEYVQDIFESIRWLGIDYDEGPEDAADFEKNWSQHLRLDRPLKMADKLRAFSYACTCTRSQLSSYGAIYPGFCRNKHIPFDTKDAAIRIWTEENTEIRLHDFFEGDKIYCPNEIIGDFVIRKKDGLPSYQLVSLADDLFFRINFIVRGEDLLASTAGQLWLAKLSGERSFQETVFIHHPLMKNEQNEKLSKSAGADSLKALRDKGKTAEDLIGDFSEWIGMSKRYSTAEALLKDFDPSRIHFSSV